MKSMLIMATAFLSVSAFANELWTASVCESGATLGEATVKLNGSTKRGELRAFAYRLGASVQWAEFKIREVSATSVAVDPHPATPELKYTVCATVYR